MRVFAAAACAAACSFALPMAGSAQIGAAANTTLLGRFDVPGEQFCDVWGYVAPSGKEYAILGSRAGTYVLDCTDPTAPRQRAFLPGPRSYWRDARIYRHYAYIVTEGGGGMQIVDLAEPDQPHPLGTFGESLWGNTHNVSIDLKTGTLYACGTDVGMPILDLRADPTNPTLLGIYTGAQAHDLQVQDGYAHLADIFRRSYDLLDARSLPALPRLGRAPVTNCHNVWPTRDNDYAVATTEGFGKDPPGACTGNGGGLTIFDIRDKRLPVPIATWHAGGCSTSVHNAYVRDRVCHMSYYSEGYQAVDLSDPRVPVFLASYDTSSEVGGFNGAWGCYPFQPSGVIYVSDIDEGLYLLRSKAAARRYGSGTPGRGGHAPAIHSFGSAFQGNELFALELEGAPAGASAELTLSTAAADLLVGGVRVLVSVDAQIGIYPATTDASGRARIPLPVDGTLPAGKLFAQWIVTDGAAPGGLASTRGLEFEVYTAP